jgi:hypothetical protein
MERLQGATWHRPQALETRRTVLRVRLLTYKDVAVDNGYEILRGIYVSHGERCVTVRAKAFPATRTRVASL